MHGYEVCDFCGHNILIPWSSLDSNIAEFDLRFGVVICTEECYHENIIEAAEYRCESLTNR